MYKMEQRILLAMLFFEVWYADKLKSLMVRLLKKPLILYKLGANLRESMKLNPLKHYNSILM